MNDNFHTVYQQYSFSVVTITHNKFGFKTVYISGFILLSEKKYSLIFTNKNEKGYVIKKRKLRTCIYVYFEEKIKYEAKIFIHKKKKIILSSYS
jgi:molybdenum cofactor biosynthesis enzyme